MPKNKNNNVSKSPFREHRNHRERESSIHTEDVRSREEKVSDLTDLFIGDYHIDTDIIHAVLEECSWEVEEASKKLFEVFYPNNKPKKVQTKKKESNGLANIAVSILMDKNSDSEKEGNLPTKSIDLNLADITGDVNNNSSAINQKQNNNLRPKVSSNENLVQYNASGKQFNSKPSTESKTLFECKSSQRDFYNKNSFEDMAVNMEHYKENGGSVAKTPNLSVLKDDLIAESSNSQKSSAAPLKTKPRFDLNKISVDTSPSMNNIENNSFNEKKNTSSFYTDKSMESLFSGGHSPSTAVEWNNFYKQLNLQPVQTEKLYPEISVNELLVSSKDCNSPDLVSSMNKIKPSTQSDLSNQSERSHVNFAQLDCKSDNRLKLQIPKRPKDRFEKKNSVDSKLAISEEMNTAEQEEKPSPTKAVLSVEAPEFVPRVLDAKQPMTRKSPVKQSKSKATPSNMNKLLSSEKAHVFKKGKDIINDQKKTTVGRNIADSSPQVQLIDPMDPLGWKEIKSMTSPKAHKSDFKINTKLLHHNHNLTDDSADLQMKPRLLRSNGNIPDDKTAVVPPFNFNTTTSSNKNNKALGKKKDKFPKPGVTDPSNTGFPENRPFTQDFSHISDSSTNSFPSSMFNSSPLLSLPPSLRKKPNFDQFSNTPLPQRENSKRNVVNHMVPKGDTSTEGSSVANRVQFVGVKTPVGKLKHYIDKKQPVMFILRGLPGSGKSYLAAQLMAECQRLNLKASSLSSDSYFTSHGEYNFNFEQLSKAHIWNRQRAQQCFKNKEPVIIIDNTNTTLWEMMPYAEMAIQNGYDIQVCEPDTQWKNKVAELTRRNQHGVTKDHIKRMKDRYENLTTEDVLRSATKSLKGKNKLPSNCNTTTVQPMKAPVPASNHKPLDPTHQMNSGFGNLSIVNPKPVAISHKKDNDNPPSSFSPSSPDQGLTQWIPAMEQRETRKSRRTGLVEKHSKPQEITLDFLNNSIKKALVDIEKTQEVDVLELEHGSAEEAEQRNSKESQGSIPKGLIIREERKDVSTIMIEQFVDCGMKHTKGDSESTDGNELSIAVTGPVDTAESCLGVSKSLLSSLKLDNSGSTGELYYSCGSEEGDDLKEKETKLDDGKEDEDQSPSDDKDEKMNEMNMPVENVATQCEESVLVTEENKAQFLESSYLGDYAEKDSESLDAKTSVSITDEEIAEPLDTSVSVAITGGEILGSLDASTPSPNTGKMVSEPLDANAPVQPAGPEDIATNCSNSISTSEVNIEVEGVITSADVMLHQKQPLVVYSDSEEEENDRELNEKMEPKAKLLDNASHVEKIESHSWNDEQLEFGQKIVPEEAKDTNEEGQSNSDSFEVGLTVSSCVEGENKNNEEVVTHTEEQHLIDRLTPESLEDRIETSALQSQPDSSESNSSTREQSPATNEFSERLYIKKKKKKKVTPVDTTIGPFLEDTLKEKSKTENWSNYFFNDNQSPEMPSSPTRINPQAIMADTCCQCEPYYFSMVYRLNSQAFSNQQPIDVSNLDVVVIQASSGLSWEDRFCSDVIVQRKSETTDRSTITDGIVDSEEVDLETLQNCFPEYSRKQLEEVMAVCHNNLEWVTNNLMDAPPMIEFDEEEKEEENNDKSNLENESYQREENTNSVKSLAQLCRKVVQNNEVLDPDDLEQQVINASQTRLQEIETFAWVRLHSTSVDSSHTPMAREADIWPDNFNLDTFSGGYGLDDFRNDPVKPFKPSPVSPNLVMNDGIALSQVMDPERNNEQAYYRNPDRSSLSVKPTVPILPLEFINCLEMNYGSLNTDMDESGLALDDHTARKIYNCLKLLVSKKRVQVGADHERQMREDEAMARALQEAEDAGRHEFPTRNASVEGWTGQMPSWMSKNTSLAPSISVNEKKHSSRANPARINSVSDTLHNLRGAWPKHLKPFKFHSQLRRHQDYSVWTSKSNSRARVADMHSIMEEEKAREAKLRRKVVMNNATGDVDVLATKIKRSKLSQMFPFLPSDVLEEIFMNNSYSLEMTVKCLESQYDHVPVHVSPEQEEAEVNKIIRQSEKDSSNAEAYQYEYQDVDNVSYEDLRKEAQFYDKLANECRQKAHRHHGEGMHHVAFFYRQEVKKYLAEKDDANQRAARLLFDKGSERLLRENTLDLHSYHISEAIEAVNLALEIKKEEHKSQTDRKRGYLTIITGRGNNSKWGIPKLKPAIICHLNNKNIRFEETAPGMFKVHLFQEL